MLHLVRCQGLEDAIADDAVEDETRGRGALVDRADELRGHSGGSGRVRSQELDLTIALRADLFAEGVLCGVGAAGRLAGAAGRSAVDAACAAPCMRGAERSARSLMLTHQSFGCKKCHVSSRQRQMSAKSARASGSNKA